MFHVKHLNISELREKITDMDKAQYTTELLKWDIRVSQYILR